MSKRNQLRALTVGAPKKFRSELVHLVGRTGEMPRPATPEEVAAGGEDIIVVEVRQLTQAQTATVRRAATVNGKLDEDKAALHLIIASCFEPGTDADGKPTTGGTVPLLDAADIESLEAQPANAPWVSALARACGNVAGLSGADLGKG